MSRLTVTEKEHWKDRIERSISKAITDLEIQQPTLMPDIRSRAEVMAHEQLGTLEFHTQLESLRQQIESLKNERDQVEQAMLLHALGSDGMRSGVYSAKTAFTELHCRHTTRCEESLLQESALGQQILKLRAERVALLDTVWLATASSQIRDLWSRVSVVLGEEATPLQQQILTVAEKSSA